MKLFDIDNHIFKISSFCLDGKYVPLAADLSMFLKDTEGNMRTYATQIDLLTSRLQVTSYGNGLWEFCTYLRNEGTERSAQITELYGLDVTIPVRGKVRWESLTGDVCGLESFLPLEQEVAEGVDIIREAGSGRSSQGESFPYFDLSDEENSIVIGIGWTGQWKYMLSREGEELHLRVGFTDCDMYLMPEEEIRSASVLLYVGECGVELLKVRQKFRRMHRELLSPAAAQGGHVTVPTALQVFDRYIKARPGWRTEKEQLECVEIASRLYGVDTYWLDAAWFEKAFPRGVGNYNYEPGLPNGLTAVGERAHEKGLRFIVWFEPERVYHNTEVHREHRDWLLEAPETGLFLLDLSRKEVAEWLTEKLCDHIRRDRIDIYRQDFNMDPLPFWRANDTEGRKGYTENCYITNLYRVWDSLKEAFPQLMIDNCASGGRRLDFEMNRRALALWRSDTGCFEGTGSSCNQNQAIGLSRYLPYHSVATWTADAYNMRAAMACGLALNFPVMEESFEASAYEEALKEVARTKGLWDGDFYPLTAASREENVWTAYQLNCEERGFALFFRRSESEKPENLFSLRGLVPDALYQVTLSDEMREKKLFEMKGKELKEGIRIIIPKKGSSVLLEYWCK